MEIRRAVADDSTHIASVLYDSFIEFKLLYSPEAFVATTPTDGEIRSRLNEGPVWVAVQSESIVGTVSAVLKSEGLYIRSMAVLPAARGHSMGRLLLQAVEDFARLTNCQRLFLRTTPFLRHAIRLYEHFGFHQSDQGPDYLFGTPLITMEKTIE
jgi:GNAT superfamily N-acetyltransferase